MENPALKSFREQFTTRLFAALAAATDGQYGQLSPDHVLSAVTEATAGWQARESRLRHLPTAGHAEDAKRDEQAGRVRVSVSTTFIRQLTDADREQGRLRREALLWRPEQGPPPPGVSILRLLEQDAWWSPKGQEPVRVADLEPDHRANLLGFLRRRAERLKASAEWESLAFAAGSLGPSGDMACDGVDAMMEALLDQQALDWIAEQPLYQALLPRVYAFRVATWSGDETWMAIADDGEIMAQHVSSNRDWGQRDVHLHFSQTAERYRAKFGGTGAAFYRYVVLRDGTAPPDEVLERVRNGAS